MMRLQCYDQDGQRQTDVSPDDIPGLLCAQKSTLLLDHNVMKTLTVIATLLMERVMGGCTAWFGLG